MLHNWRSHSSTLALQAIAFWSSLAVLNSRAWAFIPVDFWFSAALETHTEHHDKLVQFSLSGEIQWQGLLSPHATFLSAEVGRNEVATPACSSEACPQCNRACNLPNGVIPDPSYARARIWGGLPVTLSLNDTHKYTLAFKRWKFTSSIVVDTKDTAASTLSTKPFLARYDCVHAVAVLWMGWSGDNGYLTHLIQSRSPPSNRGLLEMCILRPLARTGLDLSLRLLRVPSRKSNVSLKQSPRCWIQWH